MFVTAVVAASVLVLGGIIALSGTRQPAPNEPDVAVNSLLADADNAGKSGDLNLELIQLKNAVIREPEKAEARARLGIALLHAGQAANAERELRQALKDFAPPELVVPGLLSAMLQRNKISELLAEYPDPPQGAEDNTTPDILSARAVALQKIGKPKDARAAMDRSLALRRDANGLVASAKLAQEQGDNLLANSQADEAVKRFPENEAAWTLKVSASARTGDLNRTLAVADGFVQRMPQSGAARILRVEVLLAVGQDETAKQAVDALLSKQPKSLYGEYLSAVLMARGRNYFGAWHVAQALPSTFVTSRAPIARSVAGMAERSGNAEAAGAILAAMVARQPDDIKTRLQLAVLRLRQKTPQTALAVLDPVKRSSDPSVQATLAQAYLALGRFGDAITALKSANSSHANPLLERELALLERESRAGADQASP